jgi:hypothetical protein
MVLLRGRSNHMAYVNALGVGGIVPMTEEEWLRSEDPLAMFTVARSALDHAWPNGQRTRRKRELFSAACCRIVWPWVEPDEACRRLVEAIETQSDAPIPEAELDEIWDGVKQSARHPSDDTPIAQMLAADLVYDTGDVETTIRRLSTEYDFSEWGPASVRAALVADILRDIVGNPFRPVVADPSWLTSTALALARGIHAERAFDRLPILADALQDAGCEEQQVLAHCRGRGPHIRGCWLVDMVLGID